VLMLTVEPVTVIFEPAFTPNVDPACVSTC
jgi:hypothetical protein